MDALSFDTQNSAYVYMKNDEGVMEEVPVEVGVSNGNYVEIKSGLKDGDEVYVEAEVETTNAVNGLLSGLFGSQQFNAPGGQMPNMRGGNMPDFSQMGGQRPDFSQMSGSNSGSSRGSGSSNGGQMGGGRQ